MSRLLLPVIVCLLAAAPAPAAAPPCWEYGSGGWDAVAGIPGPGPVHALVLTDDGRLLAGFDGGVGILALDDPEAPVFTGFLPTEAPVRDLAASGDRCLALTEGGVLWYGLLTPGLVPAWGDSLAIEDGIDRIALDHHTAALLIESRALLAVDVSDPKRLAVGGFVVPPVQVNDLVLDRGLAYLGTQLDRFYIYDVSNPQQVSFVGSPREGLASCNSIAVRYPTVYAGVVNGIATYDVSDPGAPVRTGTSDIIATSIERLALGKGRLFALTGTAQAVMFDEEPDGRLRLVGHAALAADGRALASLDDHVYAAVAGGPGVILDVRDARHPPFAGQASAWDIKVQDFGGERAYAITGDGLESFRLEVLEFSEGDSLLTRVATLPTVGTPVRLVAAEPLVALATSLTDLTLIDVSDPAAPRYLAITSARTFPRGLLVIRDGVYVANNSQGLVGYDISDPTRPRAVGQATIPRTQVAWSSLGDYALVGMTGDLGGMFVVDCHSPADVRVVAWVPMAATVVDVLGANNHAYVADASGRVHVFDLSLPTDPRPRGVVPVGDRAGRLAAYGRHVYYVDSKQGVTVLDAIAPAEPTLVGRSLVPLDWTSIYARPEGVYLPVDFTVSRLPPPCGALTPVPPAAVPLELRAAPNPFNPRTTLGFDLPRAVACRLVVHDLRGRRVATLVDGDVLPAGSRRVTWDGRDDAGRTVASGVYAARLDAGGRTALARLVLVR